MHALDMVQEKIHQTHTQHIQKNINISYIGILIIAYISYLIQLSLSPIWFVAVFVIDASPFR